MALPLLYLSHSLCYKKLLSDLNRLSKLILCLMLHAEFLPQAGYFWEISNKIVFSLSLSGNMFFKKLCGLFFSGWRFGNVTSCVYYSPTKINMNEAKVKGFLPAFSSQEGHASEKTPSLLLALRLSTTLSAEKAVRLPDAAPVEVGSQLVFILRSVMQRPNHSDGALSKLPPAYSHTGPCEPVKLVLKSCWVQALIKWSFSK